ncbi:MAG: nucleotidyltransferase domain-containing protein [Candidatus Omnitrophica bacterium]|nr:nucleotidyltransferase domain-containing protein [Candidatus Omnitrophota bacterium]
MVNLRSEIAQKVLGHFFLQESSQLYVNEMCRRFGVDRGNLIRKLKELEGEKILKSEWQGNQRYYRLNPSFPLLQEYKKIVLKTVGLEAFLREALGKVRGIRSAVLFGSYAGNRMNLSSDLDLLVVGDHSTVDLQRQVALLQRKIDREMNVVSLSPAEYEKKKRSDPLIRSIVRKDKVIVL